MTLNRRILRDLKQNAVRYSALFILLAVGLGVIAGMAASVDSIISSNEAYYREYSAEDGQFSLMVPLSEKQEKDLEKKGVRLEQSFYKDVKAEDGSELRIFRLRKNINKVCLIEGKAAESDSQIVLEKLYSKEKGCRTGDTISIGGKSYEISGIGTVPDYNFLLKNITDVAKNASKFSVAFVTEGEFDRILKEAGGQTQYYYSYQLTGDMTGDELRDYLRELTFDKKEVSGKYVQEIIDREEKEINDLTEAVDDLAEGSRKLSDQTALIPGASALSSGAEKIHSGAEELKDEVDAYVEDEVDIQYKNLESFLKEEDNVRMNNYADDAKTNKAVAFVAGIFFLALVAYVLSVFAVQNIQRERAVIGTLYSLGYQRKELVKGFLALPVLVTAVGSAAGAVLGYFLIEPLAGENMAAFSYPPVSKDYELYILLFVLLVPCLFTLAVNGFIICRKLGQPPLKLLRKQISSSGAAHVDLSRFRFMSRFKLRQLLMETGTSVTLFVGMFLAIMIMVMGFSVKCSIDYFIQATEDDTAYKYMYLLKYPPEKVPDKGEEAYTENLKIDYPATGKTADVSLLGIEEDSSYFDFQPPSQKNQVYISSSAVEKLGLEKGDKLYLTDPLTDRSYSFTVAGTVQYANGLYMFMDLDQMRKLFEQEEDYFNTCFAQERLEIDSGRLQSVISKEDIVSASDQFVELMAGTELLLIVLSVLVLVITMYLLIRLMIEKSAFSISLMKVMGYQQPEVRRIYLAPGGMTVLISTLISVPLCKWIMVQIFPYMITNFGSGLKVYISPVMYAVMFALIAVTYFVIRITLQHHLNRISLTEILKNTE